MNEPKNEDVFKKIINGGIDICSKVFDFVINNPEKAAAVLGGAVAFFNATRSLHVTKRNKDEHRYKEFKYYDPHTGMRWDLRRRMTNYDRIYISEESKKGRSMSDILRERGLI